MSRFTSMLAIGLAIARAVVASPIADAGAAPAAAQITPGPILRRSDMSDPNFVGYALGLDGEVDTYTCNSGLTYTYTSGYAGCVDGTSYLGWTCGGDYITYWDGASVSCNDYCVTNTIYYSTDDLYPAWYVGCNAASTGLEILRTSYSSDSVPTQVTLVVTVTPSAASIISFTPPTSTDRPTSSPTTSSTSTSTVVPLPINTSKPKPNNGPIIGGAVGGACVVIGAVALGLFLFLRKRKNSTAPAPGGFGNDQPAMASQAPYQPPPPGATPAMSQGYPSTVPSPVGSPISPYQPLSPQPYAPPYSPPPMYGNEKSGAVTSTAVPMQYEHRAPEGVQEVHGISAYAPAAPVQDSKGPRAGTTELA